MLERLNKAMLLNETPNLVPEKTGLPIKLWIDDSDSAKNHSKYYIKIFPKLPHTKQGDGVEMTIDPNPVFPKTQIDLHKFNMTSHELECVKQWVRDNWENLRKICERNLTLPEFLDARTNPNAKVKHVPPKNKLQIRSMKDELAKANQTNASLREGCKSRLAQAIRESIQMDSIVGDIGSFCVSRQALGEFLRIGKNVKFWHACQPVQVKGLYDNEGKITDGYLFADFLEKLMNEVSGELVIVKCEGRILTNTMMDKVSARKANDIVELRIPMQSFMHALDGKKAELIGKTFNKKEVISAFNRKFNDMPKMEYVSSSMDFLADYWNCEEFKEFAYGMLGDDFNSKLIEMGDAFLLKNSEDVRSMFLSEPVTACDYKMLEIYATPNCRKYFETRLPHMKAAYVSPKQFGLLKLNPLMESHSFIEKVVNESPHMRFKTSDGLNGGDFYFEIYNCNFEKHHDEGMRFLLRLLNDNLYHHEDLVYDKRKEWLGVNDSDRGRKTRVEPESVKRAVLGMLPPDKMHLTAIFKGASEEIKSKSPQWLKDYVGS